ncbi:hypothetical protein [Acinetobacter tianfuensis]|uniref:Uncharacterized protein n=1 Tax=Acinetobacter tianfuensis TaxID=2419603 RepID=A0A3A8E4J7_9GAMM|nr:hypothetical protein [Acinetobacter tianfuensis]RKG29982.1 hypothetical protein D7V32_12555 [Acinetobacter tianfuensis]
MTKMIDIKVKDQHSQVIDAKAVLSAFLEQGEKTAAETDLTKYIEHIVVDGEIIQPSIEMLFESQHSSNIYKIIQA